MWKVVNGSYQWVTARESEPGIEGLSGSQDDANGSPDDVAPQPSMPADDMEITLPTGDVVTFGELQKGYTRMEDYTVKTQEAGELKRQADEQMAEAEAIKADATGQTAEAAKIRTAVQNDVVWYNSHDVSEWANYTPEIDRLNDGGGDEPVNTNTNPQTVKSDQLTTDEIKAANERIDALEAHHTQSENEKAVDAALEVVGQLVGSAGHELVTRKLLVKSVQAFQSENGGKLPSAGEIKGLAGEIQTDLADAGVPIPRGNVDANGSTKPRAVGEVASNVDPEWKTLSINRDSRKVTDALADVMRDKATARG